jgi:hypothetical protein
MDILTLIHQAVLYLHLVAFAISISAVLREDIAVRRARRIDVRRLTATARTLTMTLGALWITGAVLLGFDPGLDLHALAAHPKAMAKLLVVSALTANGLALHVLALPMLRSTGAAGRGRLILPVILGAISTVSWLYASFIGVSRLIAPAMGLPDFMALYGVLLIGSVAVALVFVRPRVARWLAPAR